MKNNAEILKAEGKYGTRESRNLISAFTFQRSIVTHACFIR